MPFEVQLHRPQRRFEIVYRGDVTLAERESVVARVAAVAATTGFQQVLVDLRDARSAIGDFAGSNRLAALLARHASRGGWRIAYVVGVEPARGTVQRAAACPGAAPIDACTTPVRTASMAPPPEGAIGAALDALLHARGVVFGRFVDPAAARAWLQAAVSPGDAAQACPQRAGLAPQTLRPAQLSGRGD